MADQRTDKEVAADKAQAEAPVFGDAGTGLVAVTFHEMYAPYNAGETAGVDRELAARLVKAGKAHYYGTAVHEEGRPAFDGDQPVDQAVAPNHPMRSASQSAEHQIPSNSVAGGAPVLHPAPGLDSSSGRDMAGTVVTKHGDGKTRK